MNVWVAVGVGAKVDVRMDMGGEVVGARKAVGGARMICRSRSNRNVGIRY